MTLETNADGTWSCVQESDRAFKFGGTWKKDGSGKAILAGEQGQRFDATLLSNQRMVATLDPVEPAFQFKRVP